MPYMSEQEREKFRNERRCAYCRKIVTREYCSRCDEFYEVNHDDKCRLRGELHDASTCGGDRGIR